MAPNIRKATENDLPEMSRIAASAFFNDELFGGIIHPHKDEYPDDVQYYWLNLLRKTWDDPANVFLVSTTDEGEIAGWAMWVRKGLSSEESGDGGKKRERERVWPEIPPNRAMDEEKAEYLERSYGFIGHKWSGPRAQAWDIGFLATSPAHQGAGHGKALMQYGIQKAIEEQVPLSVISADGKDGFYQKLGFVIPDGTAADGEGNPLHGLVKGGRIWWKEDHLKGAR